ncbi:MAG TPA: 50S ribosomal protein L17, partial [Candidatus Omnitrophota bacterium]|nr:50S ribosomal protein L17 [Candidatus Omnitrophota bacterium]
MRHRRKTQNLSRFSSYFQATLRSLARAVIANQRIVTTKVKAKLVRGHVENLVSMGKQIDSLAARRRAFAFLSDHALVHKLFTDIGPAFSQRNGGYTRIIPFKRRKGDNAELVVLELTALMPEVKKEKKAKPAENVKEKETK